MSGRKATGRGAQIMAYRNGRRAGTHGRGNRKNRPAEKRRAMQQEARS